MKIMQSGMRNDRFLYSAPSAAPQVQTDISKDERQ